MSSNRPNPRIGSPIKFESNCLIGVKTTRVNITQQRQKVTGLDNPFPQCSVGHWEDSSLDQEDRGQPTITEPNRQENRSEPLGRSGVVDLKENSSSNITSLRWRSINKEGTVILVEWGFPFVVIELLKWVPLLFSQVG